MNSMKSYEKKKHNMGFKLDDIAVDRSPIPYSPEQVLQLGHTWGYEVTDISDDTHWMFRFNYWIELPPESLVGQWMYMRGFVLEEIEDDDCGWLHYYKKEK